MILVYIIFYTDIFSMEFNIVNPVILAECKIVQNEPSGIETVLFSASISTVN
jgi:hypothetical protein